MARTSRTRGDYTFMWSYDSEGRLISKRRVDLGSSRRAIEQIRREMYDASNRLWDSLFQQQDETGKNYATRLSD